MKKNKSNKGTGNEDGEEKAKQKTKTCNICGEAGHLKVSTSGV